MVFLILLICSLVAYSTTQYWQEFDDPDMSLNTSIFSKSCSIAATMSMFGYVCTHTSRVVHIRSQVPLLYYLPPYSARR